MNRNYCLSTLFGASVRNSAPRGLRSACLLAAALCLTGGAASAQQNLIRNPGFEEGLTSWGAFVPATTPREDCKWELSSEQPHGGAKCLRLQSLKPERFAMNANMLQVQAGQRYKVSAWVRVPAGFAVAPGTPGVLVRVDFPSKDNTFWKDLVLVTLGDKVALVPNISKLANSKLPAEWTRMSGVFQIPEGVTQMNVELFMWSGVGDSYWDDIELVQVDAATPLSPLPKEAKIESSEMIPENPAWAANHPRIVLNPPTLARVREAIKEPATPPYLAWQRIVKTCNDILSGSGGLDLRKPFDGLDQLTVGTHKEQGRLEGMVRRWTVPCNSFAFRYVVSGDERSGRAAANIALAIARKLPANSPIMDKGFFYTRTFLLNSMTFTYDWCYPVLTTDERQELREAMGGYARRMYSDSINSLWGQSTLGRIWNWNPGIASSWGLAMLAEMGETNLPDQQWLFQATRNVEDFFRFGVDQKGGPVEGPSYLSYGAGASAYLIESLRQWSGEDLFEDTHLKNFTQWLPYEILPEGGRVNNLLDSDYKVACPDYVTYSLYRLQDKKLAQWAWQKMWGEKEAATWPQADDPSMILWWQKQPEAPEPNLPLAAYAPGRSIVVARSGWDKNSVYFSLHAQQYTTIKHDQADKGQFTLYGYGEDFAVDSGYANDADPEKSVSTQAHNLILINGVGQSTAKYHAQTSGWIRGFLHSDAADWAWADEKEAYEYYLETPKKGGADGVAYTKHWTNQILQANRQAIFVRGKMPYVVLFDDIAQNDQPQDYTWLLHVPNGKGFDISGSTVTVGADTDMGHFNKVVVQPVGSAGSAYTTTPISSDRKKAGTWQKEIVVPADGKYNIWGLAGTDVKDAMTADSFFFSIDGGKADFAKGESKHEFIWATRAGAGLSWAPLNDDNSVTPVPALTLKAGKHLLKIQAREEGAWLGAIGLAPEGSKGAFDASAKGMVVAGVEGGNITEPMKLIPVPVPETNAVMQMTVLSPSEFKAERTMFETTTEGSHPRLALTTHSVQPNYLMVLVPRPVEAGKPKMAPIVKSIPLRKGVGGTVSADKDGEDLVARWDGKGIETKDLATDAQLFWMRVSPAKGCVAVRGTKLTWKGKTLFQANGEASLDFDGKALNVSGKAVTDIQHAFGEDVALRINGNDVHTENQNGVSVWKKQP